MRLVLDTAAMVAAIRSGDGASRRLLLAAIERRFTMLVSVALMLEYEAVMTRPNHLAASRLSVEDVGVLLDTLALNAEPVHVSFAWRSSGADPDDDMVIETAVNGRADAVVTFNLKDMRVALQSFGIEALRPGEAWRRLETRV